MQNAVKPIVFLGWLCKTNKNKLFPFFDFREVLSRAGLLETTKCVVFRRCFDHFKNMCGFPVVWSFLLLHGPLREQKSAKTRKRAAESMGGGYVPPHLRASDAAESTSSLSGGGNGAFNNDDSGGFRNPSAGERSNHQQHRSSTTTAAEHNAPTNKINTKTKTNTEKPNTVFD